MKNRLSREESLFVKTYEDLSDKNSSNDDYKILRSSSLIYQLLWDRHPLAPKDFPFTFDIVQPTTEKLEFYKSANFYALADGIDPISMGDFPIPLNIQTVNRAELKEAFIMFILGKKITVGDLVGFIRNKIGGTHSDPHNLQGHHRLIAEIDNQLYLGGLPAALKSLKAVSRIVLRSLEEHYKKTQN